MTEETADPQRDERAALLAEMMRLGGSLAAKFEAQDPDEKQWLRSHCDNEALLPLIDDVPVTGLHVLDAVGRLGRTNGITIAHEFSMPRGTVSKVTRKLADQGLVERFRLPDNDKEVLFRLTGLGEELFRLHRDLHDRMQRGLLEFMERYELDDLRFVRRLLDDLLRMPRIELEFRPDLLESPDAEKG